MSLSLCLWSKGQLRRKAVELGAVAVGFARAEEVERSVREGYEAWIAEGCHGEMAYLAKYGDVRFNPRQLLAGAKTVVCMAFPYRPAGGYHHPLIADYALGEDYHTVLKSRLYELAHFAAENFGGQSRPCVDTAPLPERYWAWKAGLGWIGLNHQLIVPGVGSGVFLAELITTLELEPDQPLAGDCGKCGRCIARCPGRALSKNGKFDARCCLSYLSIEHRGPLPSEPRLGSHIYGCDECQKACPHNACEPPEPLGEFAPDTRLLSLDREALASLTPSDWRRLTAKSAKKRVKLAQIKRNLHA